MCSFSGRLALAWPAMRCINWAASRRESRRPLLVGNSRPAAFPRCFSQSSSTARASRCTGTQSEPVGEVAHRRIDANHGGLGEALPPEVFEKSLGRRDKSLVLPTMIVELVIESEEALQVAALGAEGGLGVGGDFGHEVDLGVRQACLGRFNDGGNVMGWIF
jgi:hypothetical protein